MARPGRLVCNERWQLKRCKPLLRDTRQHFIMIVRIVGMPLKVGIDALNTGFLIASQFKPIFMLMI